MVTHQRMLVRLTVLLFAVGAIALLVFADDDQTMSLSQVPSAVRTTIEQQSAGAEIQEIELEDEDGKQIYEVEVIRDGKEVEFKVASDGTFLGYEEEDEDEDENEDEDEDEDEVEVSLSEVPDAVRATIEQQSAGAEIEEIELGNEDGKQIYEVEVIRDGKEEDFQVAPDGTFLGYEEEDEEEDDDDDDDEDEDEE